MNTTDYTKQTINYQLIFQIFLSISSNFDYFILQNYFEMEFDMFNLYKNLHLPKCVFVSNDFPAQYIKLEHEEFKMMGRTDTIHPGDKRIPLLQIVAKADLRKCQVKLKVIEEGISYLNNVEEMDIYEMYTLIDGDQISFLPDRYTYTLRFIPRQSKQWELY